MVCSDADNGWSRFKSFTNTEALDEGEHYNNTIIISKFVQAIIFP
jgi:hypothetical protein